jgi:hypothetical protein
MNDLVLQLLFFATYLALDNEGKQPSFINRYILLSDPDFYDLLLNIHKKSEECFIFQHLLTWTGWSEHIWRLIEIFNTNTEIDENQKV